MFSMLFSVLSVNKGAAPTSATSATAATGNMCTKSSLKCGAHSSAYMVPSSIYHIYSGTNSRLSAGTDQNILDVSRKMAESGQLPKLQVVEKDGCWFTLNNAQLDLCRILEKDGKCTKVKVDIVPLSTIPRVVRGMMRVPRDGDVIEVDEGPQLGDSDTSRTTAKGYQRLDQTDGVEDPEKYHVTDSEVEDSCTESSDFVDSDSECDWSDEDPESSEFESSQSEDSQSTDDEQECLL